MPTKQTPKQPVTIYIRPIHVRLATALAIILFIVFGGLWFQKVYTNPHRVFDGMLANNLSTFGVTKHSLNVQGGQKVDQYTQLSFAVPAASHNFVHLTQGTGTESTDVQTETIGTVDTDYSRYIKIQTSQKSKDGKQLDFSKVQGIWGKTDAPVPGSPSSAQYYRQAALGMLPFGNLDKSSRDEMLHKLNDSKVYTVDYSKAKSDTVNGKRVWQYSVKLDIAAYIGVLKAEGKKLGLGSLDDFNPDQYKGQPPVELTISVDKISRQLVQVLSGAGQKDDYQSFGLSSPVQLPSKTIPIAELQQQLQQIQ